MYWKLTGQTAVAVEAPLMIEQWSGAEKHYVGKVGWRGDVRRLRTLSYGSSQARPVGASNIMFDTFGQVLAALLAIPREQMDLDGDWWLAHLDAVPAVTTTRVAAAWGVSDLDDLAELASIDR